MYFTWGTKKFPCCISPSIRGSVSKLHIYLIMLMLYNWYGFGCDMSITKATLLRVQKTPRLCLVFYSEDVFRTPYLLLVTHEFGCDLSITKGTLLIEQITFSSEIRLLFKPPPQLQTFHSPRRLYIWYKFGNDRLVTKGTLLGEKDTSRLRLAFYSRGFSEGYLFFK